MIRVAHVKIGSNPSLIVQFVDPDTDAAINLSGATSITASAAPESGGSSVSLTATVIDAAAGKIKFDYTTSAFAAAGMYRLEVKFTDSSGKVQIYPPEDGQLKIRVSAANA